MIMKLSSTINKKISILLFFLIGIWGTFFYLRMAHEIMDETDDMLESHREIIVKQALEDPEILKTERTLFDRYFIRPIDQEQASEYEERWYNMSEYLPLTDETIPVRVFKSMFRANNGEFYELEIRMSTLERDDMMESILYFLIVLYVVLMVTIIIGSNLVLKTSLRPLTNIIDWLSSIKAGEAVPPLNVTSKISDIKTLAETAMSVALRSAKAYEMQRRFTENASHELQTPLSIALNKLELLVSEENLTEQQLQEIDEIYRTLNRAVKMNKSLLLIARIENRQYLEKKAMDISRLVEETIYDLSDVFEERNIVVSSSIEKGVSVLMNDSLSRIMVNNLLKNAFTHNKQGGSIEVFLNEKSLTVKNSGDKALDTEKIFDRFYKTSDAKRQDSSGLGLAILKLISEICGFGLTYSFNEGHIFTIKFP